MEDLHQPFSRRPRKQSLSAIIERIVLEKQRRRQNDIFERLELQNNGKVFPETCEMNEPVDASRTESIAKALPSELDDQATESPHQKSKPTPPLPDTQEENEEADDDEDADGKDDVTTDPERLKAFNMFVRLFADESLDRTIPISKQPKERVQAIMESCMRQFPEFGDRARKRLRTYLKPASSWEGTPAAREPPPPVTGALYRPNVEQLLHQLLRDPASPGQPPASSTPGELFFRRPPQLQLSAAEVTAVRQLASGYRESASFLRRSADELELLVQRNGT
ncbi:nucleolar protein 4-like [Pollicipes pollicipes]|uniref:nucleolar protein 4-like n=1 Tax=Pollicipes pollicipes TaxID=41117 RepID=UPI001884D459|nr:nucleolar protein 4-like [Pollicipes pollicipes]